MNIPSREVIEPARLSEAERQGLVDSLYAVHDRVFDGVTREKFARYVVYSSAKETAILVFRDGDGCIVGYHAIHFFEKRGPGRPSMIVRAETGLLKAYRGRSSTFGFSLRKFIECRLRYPRHQSFYFGCMVSPAAYVLPARFAPVVWPCAGREVPPGMMGLLEDLADQFELERLPGSSPFVRYVGWKPRQEKGERAAWNRSRDPNVRFYLEHNPGFDQGNGLLTLAPLSLIGLQRAAVRVLKHTGQRYLRARTQRSSSWRETRKGRTT